MDCTTLLQCYCSGFAQQVEMNRRRKGNSVGQKERKRTAPTLLGDWLDFPQKLWKMIFGGSSQFKSRRSSHRQYNPKFQLLPSLSIFFFLSLFLILYTMQFILLTWFNRHLRLSFHHNEIFYISIRVDSSYCVSCSVDCWVCWITFADRLLAYVSTFPGPFTANMGRRASWRKGGADSLESFCHGELTRGNARDRL